MLLYKQELMGGSVSQFIDNYVEMMVRHLVQDIEHEDDDWQVPGEVVARVARMLDIPVRHNGIPNAVHVRIGDIRKHLPV